MKLEKFLLGLILFPVVLLVLMVFLPLVILYGVIMLTLRRPVHFSYVNHPFFNRQRQQQSSGSEDIIDVEVIRAEDAGEKSDVSERSLQ